MHLKTRHNFPGESTLDTAYFSRLQWLLAPPPTSTPFQIWLRDPCLQATVTVSTPFHSCGKMAGVGNAEKLSLNIYLLFFFVCLPLFVCLFF